MATIEPTSGADLDPPARHHGDELPAGDDLHGLEVILQAPRQVWSETSGQIREQGAQGVYLGDRRMLSRAVLTVDGTEPAFATTARTGADRIAFAADLADLADRRTEGPEPPLACARQRWLAGAAMIETITLSSSAEAETERVIRIELASDLARMDAVKGGRPSPRVPPSDAGPVWSSGHSTVVVSAPGGQVEIQGELAAISWRVTVPAGGSTTVHWQVDCLDPEAALITATSPRLADRSEWRRVASTTHDGRLTRWLDRSAADLDALSLAGVDAADDAFFAAGAPWYFTLFGRDALWAARLLLPLAVDRAGSTLRVLARYQGTTTDSAAAEQPGKIMHEFRAEALRWSSGSGGFSLPPRYYGTIDATYLWISLLAEAHRAGLPVDQVQTLLPTLERALGWVRAHADSDGDGFAEYGGDDDHHGLLNQGWKDSDDAIRFADGRIADGPIALVEVQGYAYRAALDGADLLAEFDRPGAEEWRRWAAELAVRFRERFWCVDARGRYPALALDGAKHRVDAVASNMGHLLGTGILTAEESELVADRLLSDTLFSGYGIRTLASDNGGYQPVSYHCGSVWTHDTAVIIDGLLRDGHRPAAQRVATGLVQAADQVDGRLPELFGGDGAPPDRPASPYPASCRPQAWAAASVVPVARALGAL